MNVAAAHKRELGRWGELVALGFLLKHRFDVIARNYRTYYGEIDLVAYEGDVLVFVEVKTRTSGQVAAPEEAVDHHKQRQIRNLARQFVRHYGLGHIAIRFDVIAVVASDPPRVELIRAFFV